MKQSVWLENYEKTDKEIRKQKEEEYGNGPSKSLCIIAIGIVMMIVGYRVCGALLGDVGRGMGPGIGSFVLLYGIISFFIASSKKVSICDNCVSFTKKNVMDILNSDSDVDMFDQEMSRPPVKEFKVDDHYGAAGVYYATSYLFMTENYIGIRMVYTSSQTEYKICRKQDIVSVERCTYKGCYRVRLFNSKKEMLMWVSVFPDKNTWNQFAEMLTSFNPEIEININKNILNAM